VQFWHDHGAYIPYGLIVPIITSTQLLGPYKPGAYKVAFDSLYTNTVIVTPYRGAGRPQGVFAMERTMDAIAASSASTGSACGRPTSSSPTSSRSTRA
jgi:carbon-monoxide dehydrogenase large subunit